MTLDELKKEAERIILQGRKMNIEIGGPVMGAFILDALRAVHDAAIEKAAKIARNEAQKCSVAAQGRDDIEVHALQIEWKMGHKVAKAIQAHAAEVCKRDGGNEK